VATKPPRYVDYIPLDDVKPAPRNAKGHDEDGINRSIDHFGFAELPLLDERTGRLVAGHGRHEQLLAMRDEGRDPPDGVRVDDKTDTWLMPVIRGWASRSDADAEAYVVASNHLTTKGGWEDQGLADILQDLQADDLLHLTGFEDHDLQRLLARLNPDDTDQDAEGDGPVDAGGDPISTPGDVWIVGQHRLTCGRTRLAAVDAMCARFQELTGILPTRQSTGVEYDFLHDA